MTKTFTVFVDWQMAWSHWWKWWPWYGATDWDGSFTTFLYKDIYCGIGPFQFRFRKYKA